jgi:hypothetical protein
LSVFSATSSTTISSEKITTFPPPKKKKRVSSVYLPIPVSSSDTTSDLNIDNYTHPRYINHSLAKFPELVFHLYSHFQTLQILNGNLIFPP